MEKITFDGPYHEDTMTKASETDINWDLRDIFISAIVIIIIIFIIIYYYFFIITFVFYICFVIN